MKINTTILVSTLSFVSITGAMQKEIVLQNGRDSYRGCLDTYIANREFDGLGFDEETLNHEGEQHIFLDNCPG